MYLLVWHFITNHSRLNLSTFSHRKDLFSCTLSIDDVHIVISKTFPTKTNPDLKCLQHFLQATGVQRDLNSFLLLKEGELITLLLI
jgi:hypothetical protein